MEVDFCYTTIEGQEYKKVKQFVKAGSCRMAIIAATDDLYSNKKNLWTALDVLDKDGYVAIECPLFLLDKVLPFLKETQKHFDIVLFENKEIGGRSGCCFYDSTVSFVFVYQSIKPICWCFEDPSNTYRSRPNVFHCPATDGIERGETFQITAKLLEPTKVQDLILLLGGRTFYHIENIKNLCRYVVSFGGVPWETSKAEDQGLRIYKGI